MRIKISFWILFLTAVEMQSVIAQLVKNDLIFYSCFSLTSKDEANFCISATFENYRSHYFIPKTASKGRFNVNISSIKKFNINKVMLNQVPKFSITSI